MEMDECSAGGDSGAEEDEDEDSSHGSRSNSSSSSSSGSSTSTGSGEESGEEHCSSSSESHSSADDDEEGTESSQHPTKEDSNTLRWEICVAAGTRVKLPQDLCEHFSIFREFLDYPRVWQEYLTESQRESLRCLLPAFPIDCDVDVECDKTLRMLFHRENQRFGVTTLDSFHNHLSTGHFRPDIRRMRSLVRKAQQRRLLFEERKRTYELAGQLLKSRECLLSNAYKQGFSQPIHRTISKFQWRKPKPALVEEKTQLRYIEELDALKAELGANTTFSVDTTSENDENYPHQQYGGAKQKKKKRTTMGLQYMPIRGLQMSHEDETVRPVFSTLQRSQYSSNRSFLLREQTEDTYRNMLITHKKRRVRRDIHPELNTQGISLADLAQRAQIGQKHKISLGNSMRVSSAKKKIKLEQPSLCPPLVPKFANANSIKLESDNSDYSHTTDDNNKHSMILEADHRIMISSTIKTEPIDAYEVQQPVKNKISPTIAKSNKNLILPTANIKMETENLECESKVKSEVAVGVNEDKQTESKEKENEKKQLDLDDIDMMEIPIQLDDGIDILEDVKCEDEGVISLPEKEVSIGEGISINGDGELMQETHTSFFSLIRDAFVSKGEYRMSTIEMRDAVMQWQGNPISPLNDWYSLAPSWPALVPLALGFLAGELTYSHDGEQQSDGEQEFVPYLENKGRGLYAWIGAGRDSDSRLATLCTRFLLHRDSLGPPYTSTVSAVLPVKQPLQQTSSNSNNNNSTGSGSIIGGGGRVGSPVIDSVNPDAGSVGALGEWEPPRPLCPTEWKVCPSTLEEREEFRRQERMRYAAPHKAFTYRMHGYASVVGPVKGIYQHNVGSGVNKPRGHSLLVAERPNFVTILALVRDATARLPNGEGTRADICQLLKDSQYIRDQSDSEGGHDKEGYLHSVVSGALDRLHYEADPCVRYYPRRKEWLYLHRARSESEFEMYHQQLQGVAKNKKSIGGATRNKSIQPIAKSISGGKEQPVNSNKESTPKKERKPPTQAQTTIVRKEQRKLEEKLIMVQPTTVEQTSISTGTTTTGTNAAMVSPITFSNTSTLEIAPTISTANSASIIERDNSIPIETKQQPQHQQQQQQQQLTPSPLTKKVATTNIGGKPVTVVKTNAPQSLLQSNHQHFPHHQIQVSTSAGLQTIRLSGHSVLHSAQAVATTSTANVASNTANVTAIFPASKIQTQQQQQNVITNQAGKSILQNSNVKQQTQHALPGKTLLASQIKLVSSGQIKSLLTGHGLQGQTIFIKQSSSPSAGQQQQLQQQQLKRVVATQQQQSPSMQRIIAQIGGKPIAVQIQQSPQHQQQQQQQKILAKVLTSAAGGQLISVESLLAQKGLKLATATGHTSQLNRQGKQIIQTQYQVVSQAQAAPGQSKIIVSSQQQSQQPQQSQTVRMVTAQLAGKPIVLASGNKGMGVGVGVNSTGGVTLGKQQSGQQQQAQTQPIILPSQLLNIKTLHGLKVIPTPAGLKTTGAAVYARVIAPTTMSAPSTQSTVSQAQQPLQTQSPRNSPYGTP
ncbi:nuclear factor related to kappa-B-binding protein isoform X2 [Cephus cinctus]|uniref:Nuclear factor related to kappa-B-binding protein isoform X2 n=1 Tax=Cephus cinctus TaxID=211228 RepID=A0AAJ7BX33_CEPCN|nr:nuclear factor related to kappa-B-binding protein isoform X2 [Cephus cinctus]